VEWGGEFFAPVVWQAGKLAVAVAVHGVGLVGMRRWWGWDGWDKERVLSSVDSRFRRFKTYWTILQYSNRVLVD
jgi:hypothetical protein